MSECKLCAEQNDMDDMYLSNPCREGTECPYWIVRSTEKNEPKNVGMAC